MSAKDTADACLGLLEKLQAFLSHDKILEGANNFQKPLKLLASINGVGKAAKFFKSIQSYVEQSILKPLSDCQDKFIILIDQGDAFSETNVLYILCALAYDKGDAACLKEIADQYQHHVGVGHLMIFLGVMLSERMDYKRSETCFVSAKSCFEHEHDHMKNAVATLNLAILYKLFGDYQSARSCSNAAASLCHDVSMRTTKDVDLPWKLLVRVAGLCQEFGNYKKCQDILHIGLFYVSEASQVNLTKQLMTLQLKEQNGEKIKGEELEDFASCLFVLMDQSSTEKLPKPELMNADFITIVIIVAKMYRDMDQLQEAYKLLGKLETTFLLVCGRKHSLYSSLLYQIGSFKLGAGKAAEAVKTLQQAEAIFIYYFGKGHHVVASCKSLLGTCAVVKGQTREASMYLNEAQVLFKKMNPHHPEVAEILLKLALLSSEEGNFQSAKTTLQEAVDIFISACGEVSPKTGSAYFQAAAILQKAGESRAAVDKVSKAIDIFRQLGLQCDHPDVKTCRSLLGVLQLSLGQIEDAEEQFTEVQQQVHVPLQDEPCLTAKIFAPENTTMFFQAKTDCGTGRYMDSCFGAQVVSLVNLVRMKIGQERRNHLNTLLSCLQGHEIEEPQVLDFAGQTVYLISHKVWIPDRYVYCILTSAPPPDCFQTDQGQNSDYASWKSDCSKDSNGFLLTSSNGHGRNPSSLVFWKTSKVLEMKELSCIGSAFRESVNMLFLQPKFRKGYLEGQDFYIELTLRENPFASFSLSVQIDHLPLLVELKLSDLHKESGDIDSVAHTSLTSAVKPATHVSYFSYRFSSQRQAKLVFGSLIFSLGQSLALTKVVGIEVSNASAVEDGALFVFLEPNNSSLSVIVEKESVLVKCRTVKEFESACICSLVKNTLDSTMESLCHVVRVKFEASVQLPCGDYLKESANCSCGCRDFQSESSCSMHPLETLDSHAHVRSQEPKSDHLEGKPSADVLHNEDEEDIPFPGHPVDKISTEVCVNLLECLLSNRHVSSEWQQSGAGEMLSTNTPPLDDSTHLTESTLLSPGSTSSLNSLPTSPSNPMYKMPDFLQNMSPSLVKVADEPCDEKDDSNTVQLSDNSTIACVGCSESSLTLREKVSNSPAGDNLFQDCSSMRSSYEEGLPSGESFNDAETTETVPLKDGTGLSEEEIWILKSEVAFSQNQSHEQRQQIIDLKEQLQQCEEEKQKLELELGRRTFFEDKQKRSKKFLLSSRAHVSEQSTSCTASGAYYAFTSMEGKLLGGASPEPGFSLHGRLLEISNSLSEVELKRMKLLAKPKVNAFRLKKIRGGIELFEELETRGELSYTYVKELLQGIQRFDLVQKLGVPLRDRAGTASRRPTDQRMMNKIPCKELPDEDTSVSPALIIIPSEDKKLDVLPEKQDDAAYEPLDEMHLQGNEKDDRLTGINKADSGCKMFNGNSENSGGDIAILPANADCDDSSAVSESSAEEHTRVPDSSNGGFSSNENSSIAVSSSELSASSDMIAQSFSDDSPFSSCTSQDVCDSSPRVMQDLPSQVKNRKSSGDSLTSSEDEILERSLLPNDTEEFESEDMDTTEAGAAQGGGIDEISEASGDVWDGPMKPSHLEMRCAAGVGKDVVDSGLTRFRCRPNSGHIPDLMKDALPDGDISVEQNWSGARSDVGKDSTVDHSVSDTSTQSNEWERLGARPRDRPPVKMAPLAPSLVDLVPQEVAGPVAHGVANAFLARHSQDKGLHESLNQGSVSKDSSSQGTSYVDGIMNLSERNKAKPYFGECQADVHSRLQFPFPPVSDAGYDSRNAVGGYSYNGQTGLGPGTSSSYFTGSNLLVNGNFPSSSAFSSSIYNSFRSDFPLGTSRPSGVGNFDREPHLPFNGQVGSELYTSVPLNPRFHPGMAASYFGNGSLMGAAEPPLTPPVVGAQRYSGFNGNTLVTASEREKMQTALTANAGLGNQSSVSANSDYLPSASSGNMARVDVQLGSAGLPALTVARSNGADIRHESEAERTSQYAPGTLRSNALDTSGDQSVAGVNRDIYNRHIEAGLPSDDSILSRLVAGANADANREPQGAGSFLLSANTGGSMLNRDFGTDSVESTDNSLLALEQRVEEACALVERVLREREEREEFGREIERKEREIREQRARKRREREARELEEASRWPQQQEPVTGRSQWLCEHYQRHCRVRFPCCSHFYSCHRCHNNSKACDNEEAKASHATHLKCSFCQHEQEIGEDSGKCCSCGAQMSAYFCSICKHFTSVDKNPYHCKKCGICRIHKDKSFHCEVCNVCLDKRLEGKHKCRPDSGHDECCICLEDAFSGCQILPCSHKVHRECAIAMIQNGIRTCPVCRHPLYSPAPE